MMVDESLYQIPGQEGVGNINRNDRPLPTSQKRQGPGGAAHQKAPSRGSGYGSKRTASGFGGGGGQGQDFSDPVEYMNHVADKFGMK